jgi:hypothetical protein
MSLKHEELTKLIIKKSVGRFYPLVELFFKSL